MTTCEFVQIQTTFPDEESARALAARLLELKLVACAQILPGLESRYEWLGELCVDRETLLLCKTRASLFERLSAEIASRHPYECPQIVGVPLLCVAPSYAAWLDEQLQLSDS